MSLRTNVIRLAHGRPDLRPHLLPVLREASAGGARRFGATLTVRAEVVAGGHEVVGDEVRFGGEARLRLVSPTGGVVTELGGIRYTARYSVVGDFFSVRSENDLYAEAVTEACIANRDAIVGDLVRDGLLGR